MKKFFEFVFVFFVGITTVFGQNQDTIDNDKSTLKKGTMFVFWGWNRAGFSNSDIRFRGNGYDFTLSNVVAHEAFGIKYGLYRSNKTFNSSIQF